MTDQQVPEVVAEVDGGTGRITLQRPRAINALTRKMVDDIAGTLSGWAQDDRVHEVELVGAGERGFCSGADVRAIRQQVLDDPGRAVEFFRVEYQLDAAIAHFPKPVTARLFGISMGGGLGLGLHCSRVVAAPDLVLAMPETGIGLFPDVGVAWELAQAPGETGTYLALTAQSVDAASARYAGLVDEVTGDVEQPSQLERDRGWIDECFAGDRADAIVQALEAHADERARQCGAQLRTRSPWSVCVALEALRRAGRMGSVDEVLAQDLVLAKNFVRDSDFVEGVRAQLVDKDRDPHWRHARIEDVPRDDVLRMFA